MQTPFIFTLAVLGALLPCTAFAGNDVQHSTTLPDVPLMPGMTEQTPAPDSGPTTTGVINGNKNMAISYYNETLQQEGWTPADPQHKTYKRGDDTLTMQVQVDSKSNKTTVQFTESGPSHDPQTPPLQFVPQETQPDATQAGQPQQETPDNVPAPSESK